MAIMPTTSTTTSPRADQPITYALAKAAETQATVCPDGYAWCTGDTGAHSDPREHVHNSPEHTTSGHYGKDILGFHLTQVGDDQPHLTFVGDGRWEELDLEQTDQLIADLTQHLAKLKATRNQLAALTQKPAEPGTWTITLHGGGQITGHQPTWCTEQHDAHDLDPDRVRLALTDLTHVTYFDGMPIKVYVPGHAADGKAGLYEENVLGGNITANPYSDTSARRQPVVNLEVVEDFWMENLGPDELADVVAKLRQQADRLDGVHAQLVQARAEWAAQQ